MAIAKILYKSFYWKFFQFLASFTINVIYARALQSSLSASFYSLLYLLSLAISFFSLGLDISLNFYLSRKELSPATARNISLVVVALALSICLPLIAFLYQPLHYPGISLQNILLFSALSIGGGLLTSLSGALFTAGGRNEFPIRAGFLFNCGIVLLGLLFSLILTGRRLVETLFGVYFLLTFLQGLFLFIWSRRSYPKPGDAAARTFVALPALLQFSLAAFIANFIFFAASRIGLYLLPYRVAPAALGNYIQAYKIVEYIAAVAAFIYYPFMAFVAGEGKEKTNAMVLFMVRLSNTFVLLAVILLAGTGWFLFPWIFGRSFGQVYGLFIWLIPGAFAACSSTFFTAYFFGKGSLKYNLTSAGILLVSAAAFFFWFTAYWGLRGAAFAFSLASLFSLIYDCLIFKRFLRYGFRDLLLIHRDDIEDMRLFLRELFTGRPATP